MTLPWQCGPLAGLFGGGKCGASSCGKCGATCCPPGPDGGVCCNSCGFCSDICGKVIAVRTLKKSSKVIGEKLVCEWKHDPNSCCTDGRHCGACKPGCFSEGVVPPASAPAPVEIAPEPPQAIPAEAPTPETARQRVPGYGMRSSLRDVLTVSLD